MLLNKKSQSHFIEFSEQEILLARTSALKAPLTVESLRIIARDNKELWSEFLLETLGKKGVKSAYIQANCGVYPPHRFVRRLTIDPRRFKENGYLNEIANQQLRVDVENSSIAILNTVDGALYDPAKNASKDVLFAGMATKESAALQEELVAMRVYPESLEMNTLSVLGGLVDYSNFAQLLSPTLLLDIGADVTHMFIVGINGVESTRSIQQGLSGMIPIVQKELGLKDEESAKRLLLSNTFDFSGMGHALVKRLITELQSSIGFYEVQTGQSIGQVACLQLPSALGWLEPVFAAQLGLNALSVDWSGWLEKHQIKLGTSVKISDLNNRWLGVFSLMIPHHAQVSEKKN